MDNKLIPAEVFDKFKTLLAQHDDSISKMNELNDLMGKYNFSPRPFKGENNKMGVMSCVGEVLIPAVYDSIDCYSSSSFDLTSPVIASRGDKSYYVAIDGTVIAEADSFEPTNYMLHVVKMNADSKFGLINSSGKTILPVIYDHIEEGILPIFTLYKDGKYGLLDPEGLFLEAQFDKIDSDDENNYVFTKDNVDYFYEVDDRTLIPVADYDPECHDILSFNWYFE